MGARKVGALQKLAVVGALKRSNLNKKQGGTQRGLLFFTSSMTSDYLPVPTSSMAGR